MDQGVIVQEDRYRLTRDFFSADVLQVAPALVGMTLAVSCGDGTVSRLLISETEAYRGEEDRACHASKGRTPRTEVMYHEGGLIYMYLVYGMHWMLNVVAGQLNDPQAVLIRGAGSVTGPGRLTRALRLDGSFYGIDAVYSDKIWFEGPSVERDIAESSRIGISYAGSPWKEKKWRYTIEGIMHSKR